MLRRDLIKYLSVAPLVGGVVGNGFLIQTAGASPPAKRDHVGKSSRSVNENSYAQFFKQPPVENLWKYNDMGFDLVCVSGGKAIRGPQSAGILMGRKDLVAAARLSAPPRGNNIGSGMKVNKEEILGVCSTGEVYQPGSRK